MLLTDNVLRFEETRAVLIIIATNISSGQRQTSISLLDVVVVRHRHEAEHLLGVGEAGGPVIPAFFGVRLRRVVEVQVSCVRHDHLYEHFCNLQNGQSSSIWVVICTRTHTHTRTWSSSVFFTVQSNCFKSCFHTLRSHSLTNFVQRLSRLNSTKIRNLQKHRSNRLVTILVSAHQEILVGECVGP